MKDDVKEIQTDLVKRMPKSMELYNTTPDRIPPTHAVPLSSHTQNPSPSTISSFENQLHKMEELHCRLQFMMREIKYLLKL